MMGGGNNDQRQRQQGGGAGPQSGGGGGGDFSKCNACNTNKPIAAFSKKQRSKSTQLRCCSTCAQEKNNKVGTSAVTGNPFSDAAQSGKRGREDGLAAVPITTAPDGSTDEPLWKRIQRASEDNTAKRPKIGGVSW
jgi:hypothetical protein